MSTDYKFRLKSPVGVLLKEFVDVKSFAYTKTVNEAGMLTMDVYSDHPIMPLIDDLLDAIMEVWRRDKAAGLGWYCDFRGLFRDEMREADQDGQVTARLYFPGALSKLRRAIVAYRGTVNNRAQFTAVPVETIMNTLVRYNATSAGTVLDGRIQASPVTNVTVETNGAYGTIIDYSCQYRPLLDVLQELTRIAPGDFDMVYAGSGVFQWRFYEGQLGTDRTATIIFSMKRGNMEGPVYVKNKINDRTIAIIAGDGEEADRTILVRIPAYSNYSAGDNAIEYFIDGRGAISNDELAAMADASIYEVRAESQLSFRVLQTQRDLYGRDYDLGDLVKGVFEDVSKDLKVYAVTVAMDASAEEMIQIEMKDA